MCTFHTLQRDHSPDLPKRQVMFGIAPALRWLATGGFFQFDQRLYVNDVRSRVN